MSIPFTRDEAEAVTSALALFHFKVKQAETHGLDTENDYELIFDVYNLLRKMQKRRNIHLGVVEQTKNIEDVLYTYDEEESQ